MSREFYSGITSIGFTMAKNAHVLILLPLLAAAFAMPFFVMASPFQSFAYFYVAYLLFTWFWSGASMLVACAFPSQTATIVLIFWPLADILLESRTMQGGQLAPSTLYPPPCPPSPLPTFLPQAAWPPLARSRSPRPSGGSCRHSWPVRFEAYRSRALSNAPSTESCSSVR